jgi:hypothetical protein
MDTGFGFAVLLAVPPAEPSLSALTQPGSLGAIIDHEVGLSWPDLAGQRLTVATLEAGGVAALAFSDLGDAAACLRRLRREGVP